MQKTLMNLFIDMLPSIDVHGIDKQSVNIIVSEFINDNIKLKNEKVVIIHGVGQGILRKEIHSFLKNNRKINKYYQDFCNLGVTIVEIVLTDNE